MSAAEKTAAEEKEKPTAEEHRVAHRHGDIGAAGMGRGCRCAAVGGAALGAALAHG